VIVWCIIKCNQV